MTRRADLAVRALATIIASPGRLKGRELAAGLDTTPSFLTHVMAPLVAAGWVRSDPGPTGGYTAEPDFTGLSVLDVIEAVDGATDDGRCVVSAEACDPSNPCLLHDAWASARVELERALREIDVDSLAGAGA